MRKAHPLAAVSIALATALVVIAEGAFGGQFRLLSGVFPQTLLPATRTHAPAADHRGAQDLGSVGRGTSTNAGAGSGARTGCELGAKLVPSCGVLWGVAPAALTMMNRQVALRKFEAATGRTQAIYHAYHLGIGQLFPTPPEIAIAHEPGHRRLLLINWRPDVATWASIAHGNKAVDAFIDREAAYLKTNFSEPFYLAIQHEPENDVRPKPGSGFTAADYRAMFRHVANRLRARGAVNIITVMIFMSYPPYNVMPWWSQLYPGNDVVDWVGFDAYAYSDPGWGYGDFAEMINRTTTMAKGWPGMYNWVTKHYPGKPLMIGEWGVFRSRKNPGHQAAFLASVAAEIGRYPQLKAMCYFDTPDAGRGRDDRVEATAATLAQYRWLGLQPMFQVSLAPLP